MTFGERNRNPGHHFALILYDTYYLIIFYISKAIVVWIALINGH
jgi:hypothetical protein